MSNTIRDRKDDLVRVFNHTLEEMAQALDERRGFNETEVLDAPEFDLEVCFKFGKVKILCHPHYDLGKPIPDPIPKQALPVG
jgi:hypothetical protein